MDRLAIRSRDRPRGVQRRPMGDKSGAGPSSRLQVSAGPRRAWSGSGRRRGRNGGTGEDHAAASAAARGALRRQLDTRRLDGPAASSPAYDTKVAAFDLLDLMRADRPGDPALLDALRRRWVRVDPGRMPRYGHLERLIETEALLHGAEWKATRMLGAGVDFLPSRYGAGYSASIYGFYGHHEADGWVPIDCDYLRGLAIEPDEEALREQTWLRVVVRRLRGKACCSRTGPRPRPISPVMRPPTGPGWMAAASNGGTKSACPRTARTGAGACCLRTCRSITS